jgi:hypothetical protein
MTPADAPPAPRVGLGVIVRRGEELLLGLRHGSLGEGEWAVPGELRMPAPCDPRCSENYCCLGRTRWWHMLPLPLLLARRWPPGAWRVVGGMRGA